MHGVAIVLAACGVVVWGAIVWAGLAPDSDESRSVPGDYAGASDPADDATFI